MFCLNEPISSLLLETLTILEMLTNFVSFIKMRFLLFFSTWREFLLLQSGLCLECRFLIFDVSHVTYLALFISMFDVLYFQFSDEIFKQW